MSSHFHVVSDPSFAMCFYNNTRLRKGVFFTGGAMKESLPEGSISSFYSFVRKNDKKEIAWEEIRKKEFPELPSRVGDPIFLFDEKQHIDMALEKWWQNKEVRVYQAEIKKVVQIHKADSNFLDCLPEKYEENARLYWSGAKTEAPLFEVIFQGVLFFPEWEKFPTLGDMLKT